MAKTDRAAQLKKQSQKAKKKLPSEMQREMAGIPPKEDSEEEEEEPVARGKPSSFARVAASAEAEEDQEEAEEEEEVAPVKGKSKEAPLSNKERKRLQTANKKDDMKMLAEEEWAGKRQRVVNRLLRMLLIGFFFDAQSGKEAGKGGKGDKKKEKKSRAESTTLRQKADMYSGPLSVLALLVLLVGAKLGEEGYTPRGAEDVNHYEVMGLTSDASAADVRRSYKQLALQWHPDKNPDCESCAERFAKISKANEILSDPDRRKAYDGHRSSGSSLVSKFSVELSGDDFETRVLHSNEIWVVQVYDSTDGESESFHAVWEETSHSHAEAARFGRLDASKHRKALDVLPQRVVLFPTIFRFGRGLDTEVFVRSREESVTKPLSKFVLNEYPDMPHLEESEVAPWWREEMPRVLLAVPQRMRRDKLVEARHLAHMWAGSFEFASTETKFAAGLFSLSDKPDARWQVAVRAGADSPQDVVAVKDEHELVSAARSAIARVMGNRAPYVTVQNYQRLCGAGVLGEAVRTFCLVLVDQSDEQAAAAVKHVKQSSAAYAQELNEIREASDSGEDVVEENFHIQTVRITTAPSRFPWQPPTAKDFGFRQFWGELGNPPIFVLELDALRVAPLKISLLDAVYQQIAYEDLKFTELGENTQWLRIFPNAQKRFKVELREVLATLPGALAAFLLLAVFVAVLPELSLASMGVTLALASIVLLLVWPFACRRFFATFTPASVSF